MKALLITSCTDSLMWYRDHIGRIVPLLPRGETSREFLSIEPAGYTNIVMKYDCQVVDVPRDEILYLPRMEYDDE